MAREITSAPKVNAMGYCIGGTLLTLTLATLAAKGDDRFNSASFLVSLQDFARVGDTAGCGAPIVVGCPTVTVGG